MRVLVIMLKEDDPSKCTAARLVKFNLAIPTKFVSRNTLVLNPFSETLLSKEDLKTFESICVIDCSWNKVIDELKRNRRLSMTSTISRRLPMLLAGNPTNYSKLGKLSSAEALAGALYILGNKPLALQIMSKFKWGHTFLALNSEPLEDYSTASSQKEIKEIEYNYFH
jgi:pre-rRNA-processing protein TSR3